MTVTQITVGSVTDRGLHPKRKANEDRLLTLPESGVFLVADGVGGRQAGQVASQTAVDVFSEVFAARPGREALDLLKQAIVQSNRRIYENSLHDPSLEGMATTLAVVVVDDARALIGHVGDSRVYRFDGQRLTCETDDHSEVAEGLRHGELSATQAARRANRNVITRALGIEPEVEADFNIIALNAKTSLLLCSDGITRHIPDCELEEVLKSGAHPQSICERLKEICYSRGAEDNLTAVVVDFGEREYLEEQTRPRSRLGAGELTAKIKAKKAMNQEADSASSRISVDFNHEQEDSESSATASANIRQPGRATRQRPGNSLMSNLFQLLMLLLLLTGVFLIGRYYEPLYTLIWGHGPANSRATDNSAPLDQPQAGPDLAAARALFEEKRFDLARDRFAELARREPANVEVRYWLGRAQLETKQYQDAVRNLAEAAKTNEKLPGVFLHLALAYDGLNDRKAVSESLRRAVAQ